MKNILFFINTLGGGGAEKALVELVNHLDATKYRVTVHTFLDTGVYKDALKEHIQYKTVIRAKNAKIRAAWSKICMRCLPAKLFYKWFIKGDYDYEVTFLEGFPTKIIAASSNPKSRRIAWLHTDLIHYPDSQAAYSKSFTERQAYEKLDQVVCVSQSVCESLRRKYDIPQEKTAVLYNVVDDEAVRCKAAQDCEEPTARPLVISVGRLSEQKSFDRLLRVHKRLIDDGLAHTLWIVGEGEKRLELEAYIDENQLKNVKLLGFQKNPYAYMAKADLFVSSSVAEGFSTVITESVILGVPVISTDTAGAYEPEEAPRCSVVVKNEDALYEAIKKTLQDPMEMQRLREDVRAKQPFFKKDYFVKKIEKDVFA